MHRCFCRCNRVSSMASSRSLGTMAIVDFLDVALLGSIVLVIGLSLLTPVEAGPPPSGGPVERTLVSVARTLGASGPAERFGVLLTGAGGVMVLAGPLWVLIGRPLARRGYL